MICGVPPGRSWRDPQLSFLALVGSPVALRTRHESSRLEPMNQEQSFLLLMIAVSAVTTAVIVLPFLEYIIVAVIVASMGPSGESSSATSWYRSSRDSSVASAC